MNKYIITHEKIKMQNREEQDFIVSALYNHDKKMIEVSLTPPDEDSLLGNIYIGRVENVVQNIRAAFVKISPEQTCYLSLEDLKNAICQAKKLGYAGVFIYELKDNHLYPKDPEDGFGILDSKMQNKDAANIIQNLACN